MDIRKKLKALIFGSQSLLLMGVMLLASSNYVSSSSFGINKAKATEEVTLDSNNAPTNSTEFVTSIDYSGIPYATYTFTKVRSSSGNLCELDAFGTISKDAAYGLKSITVNYTNNKLICATKFDESGTETLYYELTSGVETPIYGNYFKLFNAADKPVRGGGSATIISSINLKYECSSISSSMPEGFEKTYTLNGEDYDVTYTNDSTSEVVYAYDEVGNYRNSSFVFASNNGGATYSTYEGEIDGHTNPFMLYDNDSDWNDKLRIDLTKDYNPSTENFKLLWEYNVKYIAFDMYLTAGSGMRLYTPELDGSNHHYGKIFSANSDIIGVTSSDSTKIKVYDTDTFAQVSTTAANKWYKVVVDYSNWENGYAVGMPNIQTDVEHGTIYFDNIRAYHDYPLAFSVSSEIKSFNLINDESLKTEYPMIYGSSIDLSYGSMNTHVYEYGKEIDDYTSTISDESLVSLNGDSISTISNTVGTGTKEVVFTKGTNTASETITVDVQGNQKVATGADFIKSDDNAYVNNGSRTEGVDAFGRTGVLKASADVNASGAYKNEIGLSIVSRKTGSAATQLSVIRQAKITHFTYDLLLGTATTSVRLQSQTGGGISNAFYTNEVKVGNKYQAFNSGIFNNNIYIYHLVDSTWMEVTTDSDYTFESGVWYRVVVDYSTTVSTTSGYISGYLDCALTAFQGEIYVDNVHYLRVR